VKLPKIPWFRRSYLIRRRLDHLFLDLPDWFIRHLSARGHWPPYSLRAFVGGAKHFDRVGFWFRDELIEQGLLKPGVRILDVGCGCGRVSYPLAADKRVIDWGIDYWGMEIDRKSVQWCQRHITLLNPRFRFYHADCRNPSYNPNGAIEVIDYRFPHPDGSFQLILLTSVFTHVLEPECRHYLAEISRLLSSDGTAYVSCFLFQTEDEARSPAGRHGISFAHPIGRCMVNRIDFPSNAVAYDEAYIRSCVDSAGLCILEPIRYGVQDTILLARKK
jgi:SAM-dependent methyltransferase